MKRHDIKNKTIVETRNGEKFIIIDDRLYSIDSTGLEIDDYDSEMLFESPFRDKSKKSKFDIMKVYGDNGLLWERKDKEEEQTDKYPIMVGDVFMDNQDETNVFIIVRANQKSDIYTILFCDDDDISLEFDESGDIIRERYHKVCHLNRKR